MNSRLYRETTEKYGPAPANTTEALAHVIAVFADQPDEWMVVTATNGAYGHGVRTGLTMGDLRAIQAEVIRLREAAQPERETRPCGRTLPHATHLTIQGRVAYRCPGVPLAGLDDAPAHTGLGLPASDLPGWAVTRLADRGIDPSEVTHFIGNPGGRHLIVAVDGKPVPLTKD